MSFPARLRPPAFPGALKVLFETRAESVRRTVFVQSALSVLSLSHLTRAGLEMVDTENLRPHYARTLWAWSDALEAQLPAALQVLRQAGIKMKVE